MATRYAPGRMKPISPQPGFGDDVPDLTRSSTQVRLQTGFSKGDVEAFQELVSPHLDLLYTVCLRMTGNQATAEDVAQDTLIRCLDSAHKYDPTRPFKPWMLAIATNLCRDRTKSTWWRKVKELPGKLLESRANTVHLLETRDHDRLVRKVLRSLPEPYAEAVELFHIAGLSYAEMSEVTGHSVAALRQRVARGRKLLRERLEKSYPDVVATFVVTFDSPES